MSEAIGSIVFGPSSAEDAMAASIVHLLERLAEVEAERDFYKAAAGKLMKPQRRRKQ
jgi:predicted P-loop ATPase